MNLRYVIYLSTDESDEILNTARTGFGWQGIDMYVIYLNDKPWIAQTKANTSYSGETLDECARNHIAAILAEQTPV